MFSSKAAPDASITVTGGRLACVPAFRGFKSIAATDLAMVIPYSSTVTLVVAVIMAAVIVIAALVGAHAIVATGLLVAPHLIIARLRLISAHLGVVLLV